MARGFSTEVVESAARVVAMWDLVHDVEPHQLRAHVALERLLIILFDQRPYEGDWHLEARFRVPVTSEELLVYCLVGRVADETRATMIEGSPRDLPRHYTDEVLRERLVRKDRGVLGGWGLWTNVYFLNAIRDALFGANSPTYGQDPGLGVVWRDVVASPAGSLALAALRTRAGVCDTPDVETPPAPRAKLDAVLRTARRVDARVPSQNIPLDRLAAREPPAGVKRKGNALTLTEQLCWILNAENGMSVEEIGSALAMKDLSQVRGALNKAAEKRARWTHTPVDPFTSSPAPTKRFSRRPA